MIDIERDKSLYIIDALGALQREGRSTFTIRDILPHLPKDFWPANTTNKKKFKSLGGHMKTMGKVGRITHVIREGHKHPQKWGGLTVYEILPVGGEILQSEMLPDVSNNGIDWKQKYMALRADLIAVRNLLQERLDKI